MFYRSTNYQPFGVRAVVVGISTLMMIIAACATVEEGSDGTRTEPGGGDTDPATTIQETSGTGEDPGVVPISSYPIDICGQDIVLSEAEKESDLQVACSAGQTAIMAKHSPLFSAEPHTSVITAQATSTGGGIASIQIYAMKGTMTDCTELGVNASLVPCRSDATVLPFKECNYDKELAPEPCEMSIEVLDGEMITYYAVAIPVIGFEQTTSAITYSGGRPAVELAMPVWWHTEVPTKTLSAGQINLALFMDADFNGDLASYGAEVSNTLDSVFFSEWPGFAEKYSNLRHYFDLWAFPYEGALADGVHCDHGFQGSAGLLDGMVKGSAILHKTHFTDCSTISAGGVGSVDVGPYAAKPDWLLVHESGHFLFGLADEYGDGGQTPVSVPHNVFGTIDDCMDAASLLSVTFWTCEKFGWEKETFRIATNQPETMKEESYVSDFFDSSAAAITNRINSCNSGSCYVTP